MWSLASQDNAGVGDQLPRLSEEQDEKAHLGSMTSRPASKVASRMALPSAKKRKVGDEQEKLPPPPVAPTVPNVPDEMTVNLNVAVPVPGPGESYENPDHLCRCCRDKGRMLRFAAL